MEGDDTKTYQQLDARETEQFWTIIWQPRDYYKEAERISNMAKELGLEEGLKVDINIDLLRTRPEKYQIGKHQAMIKYMDSGSRNSSTFMTTKILNEQMSTRSTHTSKELLQTTTDSLPAY